MALSLDADHSKIWLSYGPSSVCSRIQSPLAKIIRNAVVDSSTKSFGISSQAGWRRVHLPMCIRRLVFHRLDRTSLRLAHLFDHLVGDRQTRTVGRARFIPAEKETQSCSSHRLRRTPDRLSPRARGARARVSVESHIRIWPQPASRGRRTLAMRTPCL